MYNTEFSVHKIGKNLTINMLHIKEKIPYFHM